MGFSKQIVHQMADFIAAYRERTRLLKPSIGDASVTQKLDAVIEMLHPVANLSFIKEELSTVHGLQTDVLTAINKLDRKVDEFMATQEERLRGVKTKLDAIQSGVDRIQEQLAELKRNNPELEDEISAIEATAGAIDTDVNPVVEPTPEPTPTPDEGGTVTP